jgi:uncharacterized protein YndB with AHSA1/START domain
MMQSSTDEIRKQVLLRAPLARVWRALTTPDEFGAWFGVEMHGAFVPGTTVRGRITHQGYEHLTWEVVVDRMEPERIFSWRWHPYAVDPSVDYSSEPTTLVVFELEPSGDGTLLTVTESGFDRLPPERRAEAFVRNGEGWAWQMTSIERHLANGA